MQLTDFTIKDLLWNDKALTFLIGAGCSIDQPSCLPAGKAMMEELIRYTCHESEVEKILQIDDLRFESLIEIIRDQIDDKLTTIDYYGQCDKPNMQHFFLAEMIKKGHFVMTTNFDFLIEYALLQSGVPDNNIVPVITRQDFEQFNDPQELFNQGKKALYKIHGSPKNVIRNENTKDSLVATIQAFGSNKEGLDIFQLESFKRPLFENITNQRTLVVMGYSGSDDFDVVPTLKVIKNLKEIMWIDFLFNDEGKEKVYKFDTSDFSSSQNFDKVNQILLDIYKTGNVKHIYRINVNTSRMVKELIGKTAMLSSENFSLTPVKWLKNTLCPPSDVDKFFIAFYIYLYFNRFDEAISCMHMMSLISGLQPNNPRHAHAYLNIATIYTDKAEYEKALEFYEDAKLIYENIDDRDGIAGVLNGMGLMYKKQGEFREALKLYEQALALSKMVNNAERIAVILDNIANIHREMGNLSKASEYQEAALKVFEDKGMLKDRAISLTNIGQTHYQKANYEEALTHFDQALKISEQLNDEKAIALILEAKASVFFEQERLNDATQLSSKAIQIFDKLGLKRDKNIALINLAIILIDQNLFTEAQQTFEQAHSFFKETNDYSRLAIINSRLGDIYLNQGNLKEALDKFTLALGFSEKNNNRDEILENFMRIGTVYKKQKQYEEALKYLNRSAEISKEIDNKKHLSTTLNLIGSIYMEQEEYSKALEIYQKSLKIAEEIQNLRVKVDCLNNIGTIYRMQGKNREILNLFEEALLIDEKLGDYETKATRLFNMGILYENQGDLFNALKQYREADHINERTNLTWLKEEIPKKFEIIRNKLAKKSDEYLKQRNFIEAINQLKSVIQISEEWNDVKGKGAMLIKLARVYKEQGNQNISINYYEEAAQIFEDLKIFKYMELALHEMGAIYLNLGKPEVAIQNLENLMKLYHNENLDEKNVDVLFNISVIYSRMWEFDKAIEILHNALSILIVLGLENSEKADRINRQIEEMEIQQKAKEKFRNRFNR